MYQGRTRQPDPMKIGWVRSSPRWSRHVQADAAIGVAVFDRQGRRGHLDVPVE